MQENFRFDLIEIFATLRKRRTFIISITVLAAIVSAIFYTVTSKQYKATSEFLIANAQYTDRNNLFRQDRANFIQYFATEDDIDKVMALGNSEMVKSRIIANAGLAQAYGLNASDPKESGKLWERFSKSYDVKRTEFQNMLVSYTDKDPKIAAAVTNQAVKEISDAYGGYFSEMRHNSLVALQAKMHETDSTINILTDSLAAIRDQYKIYNIFSSNDAGGAAGTGKPAGYGKAIEMVRNTESIKDQLVTDRARMTSVINEFSTGSKAADLPLIKAISIASPPDRPAGLGFALTVVACTLAALFFSIIWVLMMAYYRMLVTPRS